MSVSDPGPNPDPVGSVQYWPPGSGSVINSYSPLPLSWHSSLRTSLQKVVFLYTCPYAIIYFVQLEVYLSPCLFATSVIQAVKLMIWR